MVETIIIVGERTRDLAGASSASPCPGHSARCEDQYPEVLTVFDGWRGSDMATASIEVSGPNAERLAGELRAALVTAVPPGGSVSPVEVERSADLVIAIIGRRAAPGR
jgi:hypothetical protein